MRLSTWRREVTPLNALLNAGAARSSQFADRPRANPNSPPQAPTQAPTQSSRRAGACCFWRARSISLNSSNSVIDFQPSTIRCSNVAWSDSILRDISVTGGTRLALTDPESEGPNASCLTEVPSSARSTSRSARHMPFPATGAPALCHRYPRSELQC